MSAPLAIGDATQFTSASQRREQKDQSVICRLIFVQSVPAAGRATQDGRAGACCSCPSLWSQRRGVRLNSALRLYQGLIRAFHRGGKDYELRWGQLYARTIAAFADRRYAYGAGEIHRLADT